MAVWQKSRELTKLVYQATSEGTFGRDYGLRNQIRRASVSIMSNIAEGFERSGTGEFNQFLSMAKGSAGEVRSQLYVALDQGYIDTDPFETLCSLAKQVSRMLSSLMKYLRNSQIRGTKFRRQKTKAESKV